MIIMFVLDMMVMLCRNEVQKWELIGACLEHLRLVISAVQPGMVQAQIGSQAPPPPGLSVMMDLLRKSSSPASLMLSLLSWTCCVRLLLLQAGCFHFHQKIIL